MGASATPRSQSRPTTLNGIDPNEAARRPARTGETIEQCIERAGTKAGNKGIEAAMAALEAALVLRSIG